MIKRAKKVIELIIGHIFLIMTLLAIIVSRDSNNETSSQADLIGTVSSMWVYI